MQKTKNIFSAFSKIVHTRKITAFLLAATFVWTLFIFWNSTRTGEQSQILSDAITDSIKDKIEHSDKIPPSFEGTGAISSQPPQTDNSKDESVEESQNQIYVNTYYLKLYVRKSGHLIEYTILAFLTALTAFFCGAQKDKSFFISIYIGIFIASCDEIIQKYTKGRSGKFADVLIDLCGIIMGAFFAVCIFLFLYEFFKSIKKQSQLSKKDKKSKFFSEND